MVPQSLRVALNVTEEEYRKAHAQSRLVWVATFLATGLGLALWAMGIRVVGWLVQAVASGILANLAMMAVLPDAKKTGTARLKKYKELQAFRASMTKLNAGKEAQPPNSEAS
jgi:fatty acid desaturase